MPVGKTEFGESPINTAQREIDEETGVKISPNKLKFVNTEKWNDRNGIERTGVNFIAVLDQCQNIGSHDWEHENVEWIPIEEVKNYSWAFNMDKTLISFFKRFVN